MKIEDATYGQRVWYETSYDGSPAKCYGTIISNVFKNFTGDDEVMVRWDDSDVPTCHLVSTITKCKPEH